MTDKNKISIYTHIPFCDHKCIYCDFYSIIKKDREEEYFAALLKEIDGYSEIIKGKEIVSIYFGGGTPSFVEPNYLKSIILKINQYARVSDSAEITIETNPGTVTIKKLKKFRNIGINRISVGIQSFDDEELKFLTRIHDGKTAAATIKSAAAAGFKNISADLIFNLPGQTKETWRKNLETASALPLNHISAYSLILERGTILNKLVLDGRVRMQDIDYDAELYEFTIDFLAGKGFEQYEVSNFALPGYECVHNLAYWRYENYLGLGTAAHSFVNGERWWNYSSLDFYIRKINSIGNAVRNNEILTREQRLDEYIMLNLRSKGLDTTELENMFDINWLRKNDKYLNQLIAGEFIESDGKNLKFTPKGYALCDELLLKFKV